MTTMYAYVDCSIIDQYKSELEKRAEVINQLKGRCRELEDDAESMMAECGVCEMAFEDDEVIDELLDKCDYLQDELEKRDKGIGRLKRQRDEARKELEEQKAKYDKQLSAIGVIQLIEQVDRLTAERDNLAEDLAESERIRHRLEARIDHALATLNLSKLQTVADNGEVV